MKSSLRILFFLLITFSAHVNGAPHLILHIDVNQTLVATDKAGDKSVENSLNEMLAKKYLGRWDPNLPEEVSFYHYVNKIMIPGPAYDSELYKQRKRYIQHFLDYLQEHNNPLYESALSDYKSALKVLNSSESTVFPSFYCLIEELNKQQISYSIILRSFGKELLDVRKEINSHCNGMISQTAKFQEGKLYLDNGKVIENGQEIYLALKGIGHVAIGDDWNYWNSHGLTAQHGKPFYIDRSDMKTLSIFFDDHIDETDPIKNIICPLDAKTNQLIPIKELAELGLAVHVETLQAILNKNYFIDHVEKAVANHRRDP